MSVSAATDTGLVRTRNEDSYGFTGCPTVQAPASRDRKKIENVPFVAVVADGIGGRPCGDLASRIAVEMILAAAPTDEETLVDALKAAHLRLLTEPESTTDCVGMGAAVTAVVVLADRIITANVGDSRAYLIEPDGPLTQLSTDHVPRGSAELPGTTSARLTMTLGGLTPRDRLVPHVSTIDWVDSARLLLCTDGVSSYVPNPHISDLMRLDQLTDATDRLLDAAASAGARDNATVIAVDLAHIDDVGSIPGRPT